MQHLDSDTSMFKGTEVLKNPCVQVYVQLKNSRGEDETGNEDSDQMMQSLHVVLPTETSSWAPRSVTKGRLAEGMSAV